MSFTCDTCTAYSRAYSILARPKIYTLYTPLAEFALDVQRTLKEGQDETERPPRRHRFIELPLVDKRFHSISRWPEARSIAEIELRTCMSTFKRMTCTDRVAAVSSATPIQSIASSLKQLLNQEW